MSGCVDASVELNMISKVSIVSHSAGWLRAEIRQVLPSERSTKMLGKSGLARSPVK